MRYCNNIVNTNVAINNYFAVAYTAIQCIIEFPFFQCRGLQVRESLIWSSMVSNMDNVYRYGSVGSYFLSFKIVSVHSRMETFHSSFFCFMVSPFITNVIYRLGNLVCASEMPSMTNSHIFNSKSEQVQCTLNLLLNQHCDLMQCSC